MIPQASIDFARVLAGIPQPSCEALQRQLREYQPPVLPEAWPEEIAFAAPPELPGGDFASAVAALERFFDAAAWRRQTAGYPMVWRRDTTLGHEAFAVTIAPEGVELAVNDSEGARRALYFLLDHLEAAGGRLPTRYGSWRRHPVVKRRIARCYFSPTCRERSRADELLDEIDYYPDAYLDKFARDGINGLWLSMYLRELPSSVFPARGDAAERRFAKLRKVVERCARYGIAIYVYFSEPTYFASGFGRMTEADRRLHPELAVEPERFFSFENHYAYFCTSQPAGRQFIRECVGNLFAAVPKLGGIINIMYGEDNGTCPQMLVTPGVNCSCPRCGGRGAAAVYAEQARLWSEPMHRVNPDAEYIGWFYAPRLRDGDELAQNLLRATAEFPADCSLMFNFESGSRVVQQGCDRWVYDYSLAFPGHSGLFEKMAAQAARPAAKLQVGCSHEDASVPFIPVPGNLYEKYRALHRMGVATVMQCWFFGNYPGIMNRAAGRLSFAPLPESESEFLEELAIPDWREDAGLLTQCWWHFAAGYREFPADLGFAWYGLLHHSVVWPLYLFPEDRPLAPSWLAGRFPEVSGDRIGESLLYVFTPEDALAQCRLMSERWDAGWAIVAPLREKYRRDPARLRELDLYEAIGVQMRSACNVLAFYLHREEMFYEHADRLELLAWLVRAEIANSARMLELCERDCRLGFHSEAEAYLFFPEKLRGRIRCLESLLAKDFPRFRADASWIDAWTGAAPEGATLRLGETARLGDAARCRVSEHDGALVFEFSPCPQREAIVELAPRRLFPPLKLVVDGTGRLVFSDMICREPAKIGVTATAAGLSIRVPLKIFDGFRQPGWPLRLNLYCDNAAWVVGERWPARLLLGDCNPATAGWLLTAADRRI